MKLILILLSAIVLVSIKFRFVKSYTSIFQSTKTKMKKWIFITKYLIKGSWRSDPLREYKQFSSQNNAGCSTILKRKQWRWFRPTIVESVFLLSDTFDHNRTTGQWNHICGLVFAWEWISSHRTDITSAPGSGRQLCMHNGYRDIHPTVYVDDRKCCVWPSTLSSMARTSHLLGRCAFICLEPRFYRRRTFFDD